jgi:ubiquinone/menaquinone biosynthesis C-methylase UbiE
MNFPKIQLFRKKMRGNEPWDSINYETPETGLILDAGCGEGKYTASLNKSGRKTIGLDIVPPKNQAIRNFDFVIGSVEYLPFKENKFDFVYCLSVVQFIQNDQGVFYEFNRVLKKKGELFFTVPTQHSVFYILRELEILFKVYQYPIFDVPHHHYYSKKSIRYLLSKKFTDIQIYGYNFNFFPRGITFVLNITLKKFIARKNKKFAAHETYSQNLTQNETKIICNNSKIQTINFFNRLFGDLAYHYIVTSKKG